jgi:scytalone dehydratase
MYDHFPYVRPRYSECGDRHDRRIEVHNYLHPLIFAVKPKSFKFRYIPKHNMGDPLTATFFAPEICLQGTPYYTELKSTPRTLTITTDYLACTLLSYSWATAYDTKDWDLLVSIVTPEVHIDYRSVMGPAHIFPSMPAAKYVEMMSDPQTLGNPLVGTQHFLGASSWESTAEGIIATWQLRAHHVRFGTDTLEGNDRNRKSGGREILYTATGHAVIKHFYRRVDSVWKLSGLQPTVLFNEGDLKALFGLKE